MKIIEKEDLNTTFDEIKIGECFKVKGIDTYYMRVYLAISPIADTEWNSVDLSNGCFVYFTTEQKVVKVDCELIIK